MQWRQRDEIILLFMLLVASMSFPTSISQPHIWTAFLIWHVFVNEDGCPLHKPKDTTTPNISIFFFKFLAVREGYRWERSAKAEVLGQTISFFFSTAPYAVHIGSFQSSTMTSRSLCGWHTDPTKHET